MERAQLEEDMAPIEFDDSMMGRYGLMKSVARRDIDHDVATPIDSDDL